MIKNAKELKNYALRAADGEIGRLKDFYFDDHDWLVRYIVVDAGKWLDSRRVLIAPEALGHIKWDEQIFPVSLTKEQVRNSPSVDTAHPITCQKEKALRGYYGWPAYFEPVPVADVPAPPPAEPEPPADPHLFSSNEVTGYQLGAHDGDLGHVADVLIDETTWAVAYLLIDTRRWLPGRHVLLSPDWITEIDWAKGHIRTELTRHEIKGSPPYDAARQMDADYLASLHKHYGRD